MMNPKLAWMLMECPNLVFIAYYLYKNGVPATTNIVLVVFYGGHYINRSLIFPMRIRNGKKMPITVMLAAAFYCSWNGYIQSKYLLELHMYDDSTLQSARFILGSIIFVAGECVCWCGRDSVAPSQTVCLLANAAAAFSLQASPSITPPTRSSATSANLARRGTRSPREEPSSTCPVPTSSGRSWSGQASP